MRSLKQLIISLCPIASSRQPRDGGNDNRAKVKNDGSGISPNTFEPLSLSKSGLKGSGKGSQQWVVCHEHRHEYDGAQLYER
jgi:hypothetical protein